MRIVAGTHKNRRIATPKGVVTRPTAEQLRESLFNICQTYIEGANFLDLFAGSGAMGLEALSRGAVHATFIDSNRDAVRCIRDNIEHLQFQQKAVVYQGDVFTILARLNAQHKEFDIIFADPPYEHSFLQRMLETIDQGQLLKASGVLFLEEESSVACDVSNLVTLKHIDTRIKGKSALHQFHKLS